MEWWRRAHTWRMCIPPTTIGRFPVASHSSNTSNAFQSSLSSSILATRVSLSSVDSHGSSSTTSFAEPSASAECIPAAWSWTPPVPAPPIVSPRTLLSTVFRLPPCALLPSVSVSRPAVSRPEGLIVDSRVRRSGWAPPIDTWRLERGDEKREVVEVAAAGPYLEVGAHPVRHLRRHVRRRPRLLAEVHRVQLLARDQLHRPREVRDVLLARGRLLLELADQLEHAGGGG